MSKKTPTGRSLADFTIPSQTTPHQLLAAEETLLETIGKDEPCIIGQRPPNTPSDDNTIRAEFLRFLLLGGDDEVAVHESGISIHGAAICGRLNLRGSSAQSELFLNECLLTDDVEATDAILKTLMFNGCRMKSLLGFRASISGSLAVRFKTEVQGRIMLWNARIDGFADFRGARIIGAYDATAKRAVSISLEGAKIGGLVELCADVEAPISASRMRADSDIWLSGCTIRLNDAAGKAVDVENPDEAPIVLDLSDTATSGNLRWTTSPDGALGYPSIEGSVDLRRCSTNAILDNPAAWPKPFIDDGGRPLQACIWLAGATYKNLQTMPFVENVDRIAWIEKQPRLELVRHFKPQPFEELRRALVLAGDEQQALRVAERKEHYRYTHLKSMQWRRIRLAATDLRRLPNALSALLAWASIFSVNLFWGTCAGYGYRKGRAALVVVLAWLAFGFLYQSAEKQGIFAPNVVALYLNQALHDQCKKNWADCTASPEEYGKFNAWIYSAGLMFPFIDLSSEKLWAPMRRHYTASLGGYRVQLPEIFIKGMTYVQVVLGWLSGVMLIGIASRMLSSR
jgi:hypothetical protein